MRYEEKPRPIKNTKAFSTFCAELGAPLRNVRNDWCGYSDSRRRAVFSVWQDLIKDGRYLLWSHSPQFYHSRPGAKGLQSTVKTVLATGDEALGVICFVKDGAAETRVRERFHETTVLVLRLVDEADGVYGQIVGEVSANVAISRRVTEVLPVEDSIDDLAPQGVSQPLKVPVHGQSYRRDAQVRQFVLKRAGGKCEYCGSIGFLTADGTHYVEAHHIIHLANQGPDTPDNVIGLCANHHKEAHFGVAAEALERSFIDVLRGLGGATVDPMGSVLA